MKALADLYTRWMAIDRPLRALSPAAARIILVVLAAAMLAAALTAAPARDTAQSAAQDATETSADAPDTGDVALYHRIATRVAAGEDYYAVAVDEHRSHNYPTQPFVTVRPPTLAWAYSALGPDGLRWAAIALLVMTILVWERRLAAGGSGIVIRVSFAILVYFGALGIFTDRSLLLHELPAGLLLSFAFGLYGTRWWLAGLVAALLAVALREIAVHFLLVWLFLAAVGGRWREVAALLAALALTGAMLFYHHAQVSAVVLAGDPVSPGWSAVLGPGFVLESLARFTWLLLFPGWLACALALLALPGWIAQGRATGLFAALWFVGFFAGMSVVAREDNLYWVQLTLPAFLAGLALAPRAIADLWYAAKVQGIRQS